MMSCTRLRNAILCATLGICWARAPAGVLDHAFTYQGQLKRDGAPWHGKADFRFALWDAVSGGAPVGLPIERLAQTVLNGLFAVELDFGAEVFDGSPRWLEVEVRTDLSGPFVLVTPRQPITAAPYALHALNAPSNGSWQVSGAHIHNTNPGNVGIADTTPAATLTVGAGDKFQVAGAQGDLTFNDPLASITFPPTAGANSPMIHMFASGTSNADRMVIAHSPGATTWGLRYVDQGDRFDFLRAGSAVLTVDLGNERVGVGTNSPSHRLHARTGTGRAVFAETTASTGSAWAVYGESASSTGFGGYFANTAGGTALHAAGPVSVAGTVGIDGTVGIGITSPATAHLHVRGDATGGDPLLLLETSAGVPMIRVPDSAAGPIEIGNPSPGPAPAPPITSILMHGVVWFRFAGSNTQHLCFLEDSEGRRSLFTCSSAAEYVPVIGDAHGEPQAGDLVRIVPEAQNPYGDVHAPFVVARTAQAYDSQLIGFLSDPALGADGEKRNQHYFPLAIYGYFPAKVTTENGPIRRGDPITASSKPGYGMKATSSGRIIGYALEDAQEEGLIQVFAAFGEHVGDEARTLKALQTELSELRQRLTSLEAGLARGVALGREEKP